MKLSIDLWLKHILQDFRAVIPDKTSRTLTFTVSSSVDVSSGPFYGGGVA